MLKFVIFAPLVALLAVATVDAQLRNDTIAELSKALISELGKDPQAAIVIASLLSANKITLSTLAGAATPSATTVTTTTTTADPAAATWSSSSTSSTSTGSSTPAAATTTSTSMTDWWLAPTPVSTSSKSSSASSTSATSATKTTSTPEPMMNAAAPRQFAARMSSFASAFVAAALIDVALN